MSTEPSARRAPAPRSRAPRAKKRRPLLRFVLGNGIPLVAFGVVAVLWWQGKLDDSYLPAGADENVVGLGIALAFLFIVASVSLPAAHAVVKMANRRPEDPASLKSRALAPFRALVFAVAWPARLLLVILTFALLALTIVFMVRLFQPTFLEPWFDRARDVVEESVGGGEDESGAEPPS